MSIGSDFPCRPIIVKLSELLQSWQNTDLYKADLYTIYESLLPGFSHWPGDVRIDSAQYTNGIQVHGIVLSHGEMEYVIGLDGTIGWEDIICAKLGYVEYGVGNMENQIQIQMRLPAFGNRDNERGLSIHARQIQSVIQSVIDHGVLIELTPQAAHPGKTPRL